MFTRYNEVRDIEKFLSLGFGVNRAEVLALAKGVWADEDISGESCFKINQLGMYQYALFYSALVYTEMVSFPNQTWSVYSEKFKWDDTKKYFACHNVDLDPIAAKFGLPFTETGTGIGSLGINITNIVAGTPVTAPSYNTVDIQSVLNTADNCSLVSDSTTTELHLIAGGTESHLIVIP